MPDRNRVTPLGDIIATPLRGAWTGNRGLLHRGREIVRFHASDLWITCALEFRGRWQPQWQPGHYTYLFFHDEAVSLAAGHRPCAECRRDDYNAYRAAWPTLEAPSAKEMNRRLHGERIVRGTHQRRLHPMEWKTLPDGTFAVVDDQPVLVLGDALVGWTPHGYAGGRARPTTGAAQVITPPSSVAVLRAGYRAQVDPSAYPE
ncbi:hypothetical protein [Leekyejoonella antrihumi]|uniref:Uncharacterized protein n=1 Tax=Leekyejoonella antrihumi TaxID=1660198 RepID=A0A563E6H3_9MICO|nr:hypothetical protein [Leekyejoonella antrihumi]TWP38158.1 hypothetical protein FGL98_02715 [Leekyejoonella antrihumi]